MTDNLRQKYEIGVKLYNDRKEQEEGLDNDDPYVWVFNRLTDAEKIVFVLMEYGFSAPWIYKHQGYSRQRFYQIRDSIGEKIKAEVLSGT